MGKWWSDSGLCAEWGTGSAGTTLFDLSVGFSAVSPAILLQDGRVRLTSGETMALPQSVLGFESSQDSFTSESPDAFGKIRVLTCNADRGFVMWSVTRDEHCDVWVEESGVSLHLPNRTLPFSRPILNVVQVDKAIVVCLKRRSISGGKPSREDKANPLVAFDSEGGTLWRLDGYYQSVSIGDSPDQLLAYQPFKLQAIDAISGAIIWERPDR
jgi:hypothetical protein